MNADGFCMCASILGVCGNISKKMSLVFSVGGVLDRPGHFWKLSIDTNTAIESHFLRSRKPCWHCLFTNHLKRAREFRVYSIDQFVLCHSTFEYKAVLNARLFLLRCLISVPMTGETILRLVCLYPKDKKCLIRKDQRFLKLICKKVGAIFWALTKVLPHCERWTEPPSVK